MTRLGGFWTRFCRTADQSPSLGVASLLIFALAVGSATASDAADPKPAGRPNIILFVTDDHSPDAGCYGNKVIQTPHLDRLAAEGTRFTNAFCTTASCSASRSVILTGLHNHANAQYGHEHVYHHFRTYDNLKSLPVRLRDGGYRTARIGKLHVGPATVYSFDQEIPANARNTVEMADRCNEFVSASDDKPFFLYFCTADPHRSVGTVADDPNKPNPFGNVKAGFPGVKTVDYDPKDVIVPPFLPDTPVCRSELAQYYQSVSRVDQGLGRLIEILKDAGTYDRTVILFTSDHGIAFPGAKTTVYEAGLRVPMILRDPSASGGIVNSAMVSLVDLVPTILEFAKIPVGRPPLHGRSFKTIASQADPSGWDEIYASHTFHEITMYYPMRVVRTRTHKLIWNIAHPLPYPFASDLWEAPTWQHIFEQGPKALYGKRTVEAYIHRPKFELYDLEADPHEIHNLAGDQDSAKLLAALTEKLRDFQKRTADPWKSKWDYE